MFSWFKKQFGSDNKRSGTSDEITSKPSSDKAVAAATATDTASLLEQGGSLLDAGKLEQAEQCFQQIIVLEPGNAQAHNRLGDVAYERRDLVAAEQAYRKALQLDPGFTDAGINLGLSLDEQGRSQEAEACYQEIIQREPKHARAWFNLAVCLTAQNRQEEAIVCYHHAVESKPDFSYAFFNMAVLQMRMDKVDDAESALRRAIEINKNFTDAYCNLASILMSRGTLAEAEALLRQAAQHTPDSRQLWRMLVNVFMSQGRLADAEPWLWRLQEGEPGKPEIRDTLLGIVMAMENGVAKQQQYQRLIASVTDDAAWHYQLGVQQKDLGQYAEAEASLQRALKIQADLVDANFQLGCLHAGQGRDASAEEDFRNELSINPKCGAAYANLTLLKMRQKLFDEALTYCYKTIECEPSYGEFICISASILKSQGRMADAEAAMQRALMVEPDLVNRRIDLASWKLFYSLETQSTDPQALFAEHCRIGDIFEAPFRTLWPQHPNTRDPNRELKIGFVSADLYNHAVASFIEPLFDKLVDVPGLSLFVYYNNEIEDNYTWRIRSKMKNWRNVLQLSDEALVEEIMKDGIDILIDLSGHSSMHRLLAFAHKPAPVQVSWMGYPGTTGFRSMDYYLSDRFILPPGDFDEQFIEKIVRLPANAPFQSAVNPPSVVAPPALTNGYVTYGSFNRTAKINAEVVALWSRVLHAVPHSRMLLGSMPASGAHPQISAWFADNGIGTERLIFEPHCLLNAYLMLHQKVDICLDTFPYSGGTTTMYAVWMGVPTVTLHGQTVPSRTSTSVMCHLGLEQYSTADADEFVRNAVAAAQDLPMLATLRAGMRERILHSAPGRPELIVKGLERALRIMWKNWCLNLPAQAFQVLEQDIVDAPDNGSSEY